MLYCKLDPRGLGPVEDRIIIPAPPHRRLHTMALSISLYITIYSEKQE